MNEFSNIMASVARQILTGFLFTSGGIMALALFQKAFKIGLCP